MTGSSQLAAVLAALGLAAGAAAGIWYATLDARSPARELPMPAVVGLRRGVAVDELTHDGLRVRLVEPAGLGRTGVVVRQAPAPRTAVARGSTVTLRIARR